MSFTCGQESKAKNITEEEVVDGEGLGTGMIMGRWGQRRRGGRGTEGEVKDSKGAFKGTMSDGVRGDGGLGETWGLEEMQGVLKSKK